MNWSLAQLVQRGAIDPVFAGLLATVASSNVSIVVVSRSAKSGKSTLLRALLDFRPEGSELIYLRGWHDPFKFFETRDGQRASDRMVLVANELSPYLPTYVWGATARRAIDVAQRPGIVLRATAHAANRQELLSLVTTLYESSEATAIAWNPVVIGLRPNNGRAPLGWSEMELQVGDVLIHERVLRSSRRTGYARPCCELKRVCHALVSAADGPHRIPFGGPDRLDMVLTDFVTQFEEMTSAPV
jgi:hypothetical protein